MILSDRRAKTGQLFSLLIKAVLSGIVLLLLLYLFWPQDRQILPSPALSGTDFYCDAERVEGAQFVYGDQLFDGGAKQSDEQAYTGRYSCKLPKADEMQFGLRFQLPNPQPGEIYEATVWRNKPTRGEDGYLVASADGEGAFYRGEFFSHRKDGDWEQLRISFSIPLQKPFNKVVVYVYSKGQSEMYFDDLRITKINDLQANTTFIPKNINLELKPKAMAKLRAKQSSARRRGLLVTSDEDWVKGRILDPETEEVTNVELRLKGDWLDHLKENKWSFRIKARSGQSWNRMRVFSIHTPAARNFLLEWILHQLFLKEDILTTRYDFATVNLNKEAIGVYAIEEHFDKTLLEYRHRREGPIVKFSEEGFWEGIDRQQQQLDGVDHEIKQSVKLAETADIVPFQENKTFKNPVLAQQYELAQTLMEQFRLGQKPLGEIFDLDVLARYYALSDLVGAHHGTSWHNQRFYYNPVTSRMEPIGYDGFGSENVKRHSIRGQGAFNLRKLSTRSLDDKFFMDQEFMEKYLSYLYRFSSRTYVDDFMAEIQEGLALRTTLIQQEFEDYTFDFDRFVHNTQRTNLLLLPYADRSLKSYTQRSDDQSKEISLANTHSLPVEVIGYGSRAGKMSDTLAQPLVLGGFMPRLVNSITKAYGARTIPLDTITNRLLWQAYYEQEFLDFQALKLPSNSQYLFYRALGIDSIFHHKIRSWPAPFSQTPSQQLISDYPLQAGGAYQLRDGEVYFRKGRHRVGSCDCDSTRLSRDF